MAKQPQSRIAITMYNLRNYCGDAVKIAETFGKVRKIGYRNVQLSGGPYLEIPPAEMRRIADDAGVAIVGSHIGLQMFRDELPRIIDTLHGWGCKYTAVPHLGPAEWDKPDGWKKLGREMGAIGGKLATEGITLQYHNHHFEFARIGARGGRGGKVGLQILFDSANPAHLQSELDLGWVARGGGDPAGWAARLKGRLDQVHVKDWGIVNSEPTWMPVGEGNLDYAGIFKACRKAGAKYFIYEQDTCTTTKDEFEAAKISFQNMVKLGLK